MPRKSVESRARKDARKTPSPEAKRKAFFYVLVYQSLLIGIALLVLLYAGTVYAPYFTIARRLWLAIACIALPPYNIPLRHPDLQLRLFQDMHLPLTSLLAFTSFIALPYSTPWVIFGAIALCYRLLPVRQGRLWVGLSLSAYFLASLTTFLGLAMVDHLVMLPAMEPFQVNFLQDLSTPIPRLLEDLHSTYSMLDAFEPAIALWDKQVYAYCNIDAVASLLYNASQDPLSRTGRRIICGRSTPDVQLSDSIVNNIDPEMKEKLLNMTRALGPPLLYWHEHFQPSLGYLFDSAEQLQQSVQNARSRSFLDNAFTIDDSFMQLLCSPGTKIHLSCTWLLFRNELLDIFSATLPIWRHLLQSGSISRTRRATHLLKRDLCVFGKALPLTLTRALDSGLDVHRNLSAMLNLPDLFYHGGHSDSGYKALSSPVFYNLQAAEEVVKLTSLDDDYLRLIMRLRSALGATEETATVVGYRLIEAAGILKQGLPINIIHRILVQFFAGSKDWKVWQLQHGPDVQDSEMSANIAAIPATFLGIMNHFCEGKAKPANSESDFSNRRYQGQYFRLLAHLEGTIRYGIHVTPLQAQEFDQIQDARQKAESRVYHGIKRKNSI